MTAVAHNPDKHRGRKGERQCGTKEMINPV